MSPSLLIPITVWEPRLARLTLSLIPPTSVHLHLSDQSPVSDATPAVMHLSNLVITSILALYQLVHAQTAPSITVTNLVQCGIVEADLLGGVLPYTVGGQSARVRCALPLIYSPLTRLSWWVLPAFINNEKTSSPENTFVVTESGAYQFQLTQKAGEYPFGRSRSGCMHRCSPECMRGRNRNQAVVPDRSESPLCPLSWLCATPLTPRSTQYSFASGQDAAAQIGVTNEATVGKSSDKSWSVTARNSFL